MDIVLDTVCVNSLSRRRGDAASDDVTQRVRKRMIRIVVDSSRALVDEWLRTANSEIVKQLIVHWAEHGGFYVLHHKVALPSRLRRKLQQLGFVDAGDKLAVSIARSTTDKVIVSSDHDFWDPRDDSKFGDAGAPVAALLFSEEHIRVKTMAALVAEVPVTGPVTTGRK